MKNEESMRTLAWRSIRGLCLLSISFLSMYMAVMAAIVEQWDKGIFFLIIVIIMGTALDDIYGGLKK